MTNIRLKLAPPWVTYVNEIIALFGDDPEIGVTYDNDMCEVKLYVENQDKASAIAALLPVNKEFGNVTLKITVIPANGNELKNDFGGITFGEIFNAAFNGNPAFKFTKDIVGIFSNMLTYVVFKNKVVTFFNDNLNDLWGNVNTLYQEIASDLFDDLPGGVFFCTEPAGDLVKPLGEWP